MTSKERQQGIEQAEQARAELYDTLSQLKVQLNYAQRIDDAVTDAKAKIVEEKRRNPAAFLAGVAGVAVVAGLAVWGIASSVVRRFD